MTYIVGVIGAALLFGFFAMLRPRDAGCTGECPGCTRDGACGGRPIYELPALEERSDEGRSAE